jgi:hypothetical protein
MIQETFQKILDGMLRTTGKEDFAAVYRQWGE